MFVHRLVSPDRAILTQLMSSEKVVVTDWVCDLTLEIGSRHERDRVGSKSLLGRLQEHIETARIRKIRAKLSQ